MVCHVIILNAVLSFNLMFEFFILTLGSYLLNIYASL